LDWKVILDLIEQSFLVVFTGGKVEKLRPIGIRGAVEFRSLPHDVDPNPVLTSVAAMLEYKPEDVEHPINTLAEILRQTF
jgi:hypothetical protein